MTITTLPTAPSRTDSPDNFVANADAFLGALPTFGDEANALATAINLDKAAASASAASSASSALDSATSAVLSQNAANFVGIWDSLIGSFDLPSTVFHNNQYWQLLAPIFDITALEPGTDTGYWRPFGAPLINPSSGATLVLWQINELQDSNTYLLPPANTGATNSWLIVEISDKYSQSTPTLNSSGGDTITDVNGTHATVIFNSLQSISVRFITDGITDWRV